MLANPSAIRRCFTMLFVVSRSAHVLSKAVTIAAPIIVEIHVSHDAKSMSGSRIEFYPVDTSWSVCHAGNRRILNPYIV
jgi:hypothetical protein